MTPPVKEKTTPLTAPYRKDFSLTSGAKFLGIGKGTLRAAIDRGDVTATKNAAGHYIIEGAQIFQYEKNLEADQLKDVLTRVSTEGDTGVNTSASTSSTGGAGTGVEGGVDTGAGTPSSTGEAIASDRRIGTVSKDMHQTVVESLEARLRDKDGMIKDLKDSVESWQTQAKSWQNHADNNLRLLTDERTKSEPLQPDINLESEEQGGHMWWNIAASILVVGILGTATYFRADIAEKWTSLTAVDSSAPAVVFEAPKG